MDTVEKTDDNTSTIFRWRRSYLDDPRTVLLNYIFSRDLGISTE